MTLLALFGFGAAGISGMPMLRTGLSRAWDVWGTIALVLPFAAAALMIWKPALPAL